MPPKKGQPDAKNKAAKKVQSAADKTFGLKNKNKSSKVQKFVQQVETQTATNLNRREAENARRAAEKKAAEQARLESAALLRPVIQQQKVPFGVDPKTVLCAFFKQGLCTKGAKCKFSHNLEMERKTAKKDLYTDARVEKEEDTMDNWDEEKLRSVIMSKHGNPKTTTDIVCKYFIDAVENGKYGWFWVCPNGGTECKYKHSLPPGFVLKTKEQKRLEKLAAADKPQITLEEFIETERHQLPKELTPVTLESFTRWKLEREAKKQADEESELKKQKGPSKMLSGRQLMDSGKFIEDTDSEDGAWDVNELHQRVEEIDQGNIFDDNEDGQDDFESKQSSLVSENSQDTQDTQDSVDESIKEEIVKPELTENIS